MRYLKQQYMQAVQRSGYELDRQQFKAVAKLELLSERLDEVAAYRNPLSAALKRISSSAKAKGAVKGCYLWGSVGRGKTWLMDLFYTSLPFADKQRWHYHEFMHYIHEQLSLHAGQRDPLKVIAKKLASNHRVLCLDEFQVSDITDAMLLQGLLTAIFDTGVVLVMTSNCAPDELYKNGLQREQFAPAIELIKRRSEIICLQGAMDYRRSLIAHDIKSYFLQSEISEQALLEQIRLHSRESHCSCQETTVEINDRQIPVKCAGKYWLWFRFAAICGEGRATNDYLAIAENYHMVVISEIPVLTGACDDMVKRFVHLVDTFYDSRIRLLLHAPASMAVLYQGRRLQGVFSRTLSRLREMNSKDYWCS